MKRLKNKVFAEDPSDSYRETEAKENAASYINNFIKPENLVGVTEYPMRYCTGFEFNVSVWYWEED